VTRQARRRSLTAVRRSLRLVLLLGGGKKVSQVASHSEDIPREHYHPTSTKVQSGLKKKTAHQAHSGAR